jgi:asparagine N-glycosylation enzyme membrane subunit Stt3
MTDRKPRYGGWFGILVLTSTLVYLVAPVFEFMSYPWIHHSGWEGRVVQSHLALGVLGSLGGVILSTRDRNLWWLLTPATIITATILAFWLILLAARRTMH